MRLPLLLALVLPLPATAGQLSDLLMAPGVFENAGDGPLLAYAEARAVPEGAGLEPVEDGRLLLALADGPEGPKLALTQDADGTERPVASFSTGTANPVLLYFLEATVRAMSDATGGSPFYIRNRMREALTAADLGPARDPREVVLHPFEADRNRGRMGAFADLSLRLRFDADEPGRLLELSADTAGDAGGYHHRLTLTGED
jgi:hypothetical protein